MQVSQDGRSEWKALALLPNLLLNRKYYQIRLKQITMGPIFFENFLQDGSDVAQRTLCECIIQNATSIRRWTHVAGPK